MTVAWDSTGKFIVGNAFNGQAYAQGPIGPGAGYPTVDILDTNDTVALPVSVFNESMNAATANLRSQTVTVDPDGNGPQQFTFTVVTTWGGWVFFAGDVVQDILDLIANPPV